MFSLHNRNQLIIIVTQQFGTTFNFQLGWCLLCSKHNAPGFTSWIISYAYFWPGQVQTLDFFCIKQNQWYCFIFFTYLDYPYCKVDMPCSLQIRKKHMQVACNPFRLKIEIHFKTFLCSRWWKLKFCEIACS